MSFRDFPTGSSRCLLVIARSRPKTFPGTVRRSRRSFVVCRSVTSRTNRRPENFSIRFRNAKPNWISLTFLTRSPFSLGNHLPPTRLSNSSCSAIKLPLSFPGSPRNRPENPPEFSANDLYLTPTIAVIENVAGRSLSDTGRAIQCARQLQGLAGNGKSVCSFNVTASNCIYHTFPYKQFAPLARPAVPTVDLYCIIFHYDKVVITHFYHINYT